MCCFTPLPEDIDLAELPTALPDPFSHRPHPIAVRAARELQQRLATHGHVNPDLDSDGVGRMLGVLVVKDASGRLGYLSAFTGTEGGKWRQDGFVPPLFDVAKRAAVEDDHRQQDVQLHRQLEQAIHATDYLNCKAQHRAIRERRDIELAALQRRHQRNKQQRHYTRAAILARPNPSTTDAAEMERLNRASQQARREKKQTQKDWQERLSPIVDALQGYEQNIAAIEKQIEQNRIDHETHTHGLYRIENRLGEPARLSEIFAQQTLLPGSGDCAAPKLFGYAFNRQWQALAFAQFWWGRQANDSVRHHGYFYPPCRGRCKPILDFMLQGLALEPAPSLVKPFDESIPAIIYEDHELLAVNKPAGLLSVPGKDIDDSVISRLRTRLPRQQMLSMVHRLDLATSGVLLVAKDPQTHKHLQQQFAQRRVEKRYVALLSKTVVKASGIIDLPLRVDLCDRPRQRVCHQHGKPAQTRWQTISQTQQHSRVYFYPLTGRTHQLRIHAAHQQGLNAPIVGDELYGEAGDRLYLHAESIRFVHPKHGGLVEIEVPAPF
jgi:tRNA pseudouridine32 synthase/23S rRNA pseudouridine746 synthase